MLFAASIFSWAIIIQKIRLFRNIKKLSDEFDSIFWSGKSIKEIQAEFLESESFPIKNVFDEDAPVAYDDINFSYDPKHHDPRGRIFSIGVNYNM